MHDDRRTGGQTRNGIGIGGFVGQRIGGFQIQIGPHPANRIGAGFGATGADIQDGVAAFGLAPTFGVGPRGRRHLQRGAWREFQTQRLRQSFAFGSGSLTAVETASS